MGEDIKKILALAIWAPSGENCQPWKFKIQGEQIFIYNLPERDQSLYNWNQSASYLAHGALVENIIIAAKEFGYEPSFSSFPNPESENLISIITLKLGQPNKDPLFSEIKNRCSNRKSYKTEPLPTEQKQSIMHCADDILPGGFKLVEGKNKIENLSKITSLNERIIFENKGLHNFFFNHINWNKEEDNKKSVGFFLDTLELPPPAKGAFKLVKNWKFLNILNKIGFSKTVAKDNSKTHSAAAAHGLISLKTNSKENFFMAGRALERIWLTASKMGLSMQPMTGMFYLYLQIKTGNTKEFNKEQIAMIEGAYKNISENFGIPNEIIAMYFRLGLSDGPSARSSRLPLQSSLL